MKKNFYQVARLSRPSLFQVAVLVVVSACAAALFLQFDDGEPNIEYFYIDTKGRKVLNGLGFYGDSFSDGLALRCDKYRREERSRDFCYFDTSGRVQLKIKAMEAYPFSDGRALVRIDSRESPVGLVGFIDKHGKWVIPPIYRTGRTFSDKRALVITKDGYPQYVDLSGNVVLGPKDLAVVQPTLAIYQFDFGAFSEGLASCQSGDSSYYITENGERALGRSWTGKEVELNPFCEGVATVWHRDRRLNFVKNSGEVISIDGLQSARSFSEGLIAVKIDSRWGYADKNFRLVIEPMFEDASEFSNGLARITLGGKAGFINRKGEVVVTPQYAYCGDFSDGLALVIPFLNSPKRDRFEKPALFFWGTPSGKYFSRTRNVNWELLPIQD